MSAKIEEIKQILLQFLKKKEKSTDTDSEPIENSIRYAENIIYTDSIIYTEINKTNPGINQNINQNINPNIIIDNTYNTYRNI